MILNNIKTLNKVFISYSLIIFGIYTALFSSVLIDRNMEFDTFYKISTFISENPTFYVLYGISISIFIILFLKSKSKFCIFIFILNILFGITIKLFYSNYLIMLF